jgi:hypothetical protein
VSGDQLSAPAAVVAYQAVTLTELRGLFDQVEFDVKAVLERELRVSDTLDSVESEFDAVRACLHALGVVVPAQESQLSAATNPGVEPPSTPVTPCPSSRLMATSISLSGLPKPGWICWVST